MLFRLEHSELFISIGKKISDARKSSRRKTNSISKILNIPNEYLILIEKGLVKDVPSHIPIMAFTRTYARFLDVDISEEWMQFKIDNKKSKKKRNDVKVDNPLPSKFLIFTISFLCLLGIIYVFLNNTPNNYNGNSIDRKEHSPKIKDNENTLFNRVDEFEEKISVSIPKDIVDDFEIFSTSEVSNKGDLSSLIKIFFFEETWIEIFNQDNLLIHSRLFKMDEAITLEIDDENTNYFLNTGNLGGFKISFNGRIFSLLGESSEVRKNIPLLNFLDRLGRT